MSKKYNYLHIARFFVLAMSIGFPILARAEEYGTDNEKKEGQARDEYVQKTRKDTGITQVNVDGNKTNDERGKIKDDYMDSVIFIDVQNKITNNTPYVQAVAHATNVKILATPASDIAAEEGAIETARLAAIEKEKAKAEVIPSYYGGGYCRMKTPVNLSRASEFTLLDCLINFGQGQYRPTQILAGVYPDYTREIAIALPVYASFENGKRSSVSGIVMSETKGSINIADYVDNRRIRQLIAEAGLATNDIAYRYTVAYMQALQASKVKNEISYVNTVDPNTGNSVPVPVQTTNVQAPTPSDYFAAAGVELVSKLFSIGATEYLYSAEPLFKIYEGKRVWVEGVFDFDDKGIAKKFGIIAEQEASGVSAGNAEWTKKRDSIAKKYDISPGERSDMINSLKTQSQTVSPIIPQQQMYQTPYQTPQTVR